MKFSIPRFLLIIYLVFNFTSLQAKQGYQVGDTAPGFTLRGLDNQIYSLKQLRQKGHVMLVFWAVECVYCFAHIKLFKKAQQQYGNRLTIAAINIGGEYRPEVEEYVKDNAIHYLVLADRLKNLDVGESYHIIGTPTIVLVSPEGRVLYYGHHMPKLEKWLH